MSETKFAVYLENEKRPTYIRELEIGLAHLIGAPAELKLGLSEKHTKFEKNLPRGFDKSADLLCKLQNHEEDFFKSFVLLKKFELYVINSNF